MSLIIYYWKSSYSITGLRILFFYSIVIPVINLLSFLHPESALLYASFTIAESIAFVSFLVVQIKNSSVKRALFITGSALVLFQIVYPLFNNETKVVDSIPIGVEAIVILIFAYYYLYEETNDTSTLYIYSTFPFWIIIGMVLYFSGSFFTYLFASTLNEDEVKDYWWLTNLLSCIKNIFFAIGIIVNSKPPTRLPPSDFDLAA